MALEVSPRAELDDMEVGEDYAFALDLKRELDQKTVQSYTYTIYDSSGSDVTATMGGGSSIASGLITFGIKAVAIGKYTLKFVVTCNEFLPDGVTRYEFFIGLTVVVS